MRVVLRVEGPLAGRAQLLERGKTAAVILGADRRRPGVVRFVDAGQFGGRQRRIDARMVLAERADAGHAAAHA